MSFRVVIRIFIDGELTFRETFDGNANDSDLAVLVERHLHRIKHEPVHMIELEFLDVPDPMQRFFRFGTDSRAMVKPIALPAGGGVS